MGTHQIPRGPAIPQRRSWDRSNMGSSARLERSSTARADSAFPGTGRDQFSARPEGPSALRACRARPQDDWWSGAGRFLETSRRQGQRHFPITHVELALDETSPVETAVSISQLRLQIAADEGLKQVVGKEGHQHRWVRPSGSSTGGCVPNRAWASTIKSRSSCFRTAMTCFSASSTRRKNGAWG